MSRVLLLGECLLRIDLHSNFYALNNSSNNIYVGGSELNVACKIAENDNHHVSFNTVLPDNLIGEGVVKYMKQNTITPQIKFVKNSRVGTYYHSQGIGVRNSIVEYDRKFSAFDTTLAQVDLENLDHFHVSGISAALSSKHQEMVLDIMKKCSKNNITVSYDSNYRQKLWTQTESGAFFKKALPYINILFAGDLDFVHLLGMDSEMAIKDKIDSLSKEHSNLEIVAFTHRNVISTTEHELTGYLYHNSKIYETQSTKFSVVDRIGGGDMFTGSVLDLLLDNNEDYQYIVEQSMFNSIIEQTYHGDYIYDKVIKSNSMTGVSR